MSLCHEPFVHFKLSNPTKLLYPNEYRIIQVPLYTVKTIRCLFTVYEYDSYRVLSQELLLRKNNLLQLRKTLFMNPKRFHKLKLKCQSQF